MVSPSFVKSAYQIKDQQTRRQVNFRNTKIRYFVVVIACLVVFGCQYCFDNPSALQSAIEQNQYQQTGQHLQPSTFNLLYSLYAFPNIVVPIIGGMIIDSKGPRVALILTASLCVLGQTVFCFGGFKNVWMIMLVGRVIFGLGGQVLHSAQNTIISRWFKASELSMVLGLCISVPKMGSSLNAILSTKLSAKFQNQEWDNLYPNVGMPTLVGLGFMVFSLLLAFLLSHYDKKTQKQQDQQYKKSLISKSHVIPPKRRRLITKKSTSQFLYLSRYQPNAASSQISINQQQKEQHGGHLNVKGIKKLPITFWLLLLVSMLSQGLFIPFLDNGNSYFISIYKPISNPDEAGLYLILPYIVSSVLVVPLGYLADKAHNRGYLLIGSTIFTFLTYSFMLYVQTDANLRDSHIVPWIPVFLLGICICIFCTIIVPTIPMICPPQLLGTGFGLMEVLQNLALGLFPLLAGMIRATQADKNNKQLGQLKGFHLQTLFFYIMSAVCVVLAIFVQVADRFRGNNLKLKDFRKLYISKVMDQQQV